VRPEERIKLALIARVYTTDGDMVKALEEMVEAVRSTNLLKPMPLEERLIGYLISRH
jgi:hypothetical protein